MSNIEKAKLNYLYYLSGYSFQVKLLRYDRFNKELQKTREIFYDKIMELFEEFGSEIGSDIK